MEYYVWANGDCANKTEYIEEARKWEREFLEEDSEDVYILDENNVVVDENYETEIFPKTLADTVDEANKMTESSQGLKF